MIAHQQIPRSQSDQAQVATREPKLLDRKREHFRTRHYRIRTEPGSSGLGSPFYFPGEIHTRWRDGKMLVIAGPAMTVLFALTGRVLAILSGAINLTLKH